MTPKPSKSILAAPSAQAATIFWDGAGADGNWIQNTTGTLALTKTGTGTAQLDISAGVLAAASGALVFELDSVGASESGLARSGEQKN